MTSNHFRHLIVLLMILSVAQVGTGSDLAILKSAGVGAADSELLQFFEHRIPNAQSRAAAEKWLAVWESGSVAERSRAVQELVALGPAALPVLRRARMLSPENMTTAIDECISRIGAAELPEVQAAAARILAERRVAAAVAMLLEYLPYVNDAWVEEELCGSLGTLALGSGQADAALLNALKGTGPQRRSAAYVLASRAGFARRAVVRQLFTDSDADVRQAVAAGLTGKSLLQSLRDSAAADESLLLANRVRADTQGLLEFLRSRIVDESEESQVKQLVRALGSDAYPVRSRAFAALLAKGTAVLGFLHEAEKDEDLEVARRVNQCIDEISRGPGPMLPIAVIHRLLSTDPHPRAPAGEIIRALLDYLPFAEDSAVEEEAIKALCLASARELTIEPRLTLALTDPKPARRGAAAYVLGKVGTEDSVPQIVKLLDDDNAQVRFRAAQGLLAGNDSRAIRALIALLDGPTDLSWQAEEDLRRLAGDTAPLLNSDSPPDTQRKQLRKLWQSWSEQHGANPMWSRLHHGNAHLGLLTIAEYESARGRNGGRVWERGPDGSTRWSFTVYGAMDAQVLPNGHVLVAENIANRVSERDKKGEIKWEHSLATNPVACQRLPNGNTFIATYNELLEVTPDRKLVYSHKRGPAFFIFSAQKLATGRIVCMTAQGNILEIDAGTGKELRSINVAGNGGWCGVEVLPNGRYLVASMNDGMVREIDAAGRAHWSCQYPGAFRATRLPNGHTLVSSMTTRKVGEFDRNSALRTEITCEGRPWSLRSR